MEAGDVQLWGFGAVSFHAFHLPINSWERGHSRCCIVSAGRIFTRFETQA